MRTKSLALIVLVAGCDADGGVTALDEALSHAASAAVCGPAASDEARCHARVIVDATGQPAASSTPSGYTPADLRSAYAIPSGGGTLIAIVDAYDEPNAESNLNVYRAQFGIPACTSASGCFQKVNQNGVAGNYPRQNVGWDQEIDLDLDMVSATCPSCRIVLVEANSAQNADLYAAENTAAALGAKVISNSWGGPESSSDLASPNPFNHPGVAITVSSGDSGFGPQFPAASPYVTAVGGTHLTRSGNGWGETAWSGAGSGCSAFEPKPTWQKDPGCAKRTIADVSAVADPNTGVAVYTYANRHNTAWLVFGGTSVAAPLVAGVYGVANNGATASTAYANTRSLRDVTSGSNGSCGGSYLCTAGPGYDGPTGLGTPQGTGAF
jgi:subtilase family serine protease